MCKDFRSRFSVSTLDAHKVHIRNKLDYHTRNTFRNIFPYGFGRFFRNICKFLIEQPDCYYFICIALTLLKYYRIYIRHSLNTRHRSMEIRMWNLNKHNPLLTILFGKYIHRMNNVLYFYWCILFLLRFKYNNELLVFFFNMNCLRYLPIYRTFPTVAKLSYPTIITFA